MFGSKTRTYIESSTQRLYEDREPFIKESITSSVLTNGDFTSDFQANYLDSVVMKGKQAIRYAEKEYPYGLPNGTVHNVQAYDDEVRRVLKSILKTNVEVVLNVVDTANPELFSRNWLMDSRGYNPDTLVVTKPPFTPPDGATGSIRVDSIGWTSDTTINITYIGSRQVGSNTEPYYRSETYTLDTPVQVKNPYYHVAYFEIDNRGNRTSDLSYWFYDGTDTSYPSLYLSFGLESKSLYYPIIPIRMHKVNYTSSDRWDTKLFKSSRRLLNFFGIDIKELGSAVHTSPDIDDIDHAYVVMGVDIADGDATSLTYLHSYFSYLFDEARYTKQDFDYWEAGNQYSVPAYNSIEIADATYRMVISYNYITKEITQGKIGEVGTVSRSITYESRDAIDGTGNSYSYDVSLYKLTKQITTDTIEIVSVSGLTHTNYVYTDDTVVTSLSDAFDDENDKNNFIVPINYIIAQSLDMNMSMDILYRSMRLVLNTKIKKKLKWYETGFFSFFLKVVGLVLAVYGFYMFTAQLIMATTAIQAATIVLQAALISVAVNFAMDFLVSAVGLEAAMVIGIIGAAVSMSGYNPSIGSVGSYKLPNAIDLLQLSNTVMSSIQRVSQDMISDIYDEMLEFSEYAQDLLSELDETAPSDALDPWSINMIDTTMDGWETPEEYLQRTTYSENIGILALEAPTTFVDRMLELDLPKNDIRTHLN